jgi:hypothetical protein
MQNPSIQIVVAAKCRRSDHWDAQLVECHSMQNGEPEVIRTRLPSGDFKLIGTQFAVTRVDAIIRAEPLYKDAMARQCALETDIDLFDELSEQTRIFDQQVRTITYHVLQEMAFDRTAIGGEARLIDTRGSSGARIEVLTEQEVYDLSQKPI